ncbi:TIGR03013 family XrtA/PEP-CTERM system glycosyltransferase [Chitinimonas sp.]|uniref:TIGR03013 family XrtA/PEP-CTERM system glycosyltransferase n=1 Tax=Chitinimonas sp. TaxID=1934313 RepID=UPI002F9307A5
MGNLDSVSRQTSTATDKVHARVAASTYNRSNVSFLSPVAKTKVRQAGRPMHGESSTPRRPRGLLTHRVMIFGAGAEAESVGKVLRKSDAGVQIVGYYPSPTCTDIRVPTQNTLSRDMSLSDTAHALKVNEIIVAVRERRGGILPLRELLDCKLSGMRVLDLASYFERSLGQIRMDSLKAGWLIFGDGFRQGWARTLVKRTFDIVASSLLLALALPIMLITAMLIMLEDGMPILYRQERVGLGGRLFNVIKFRSMRVDAEKDGRPRWATANDDRVTRVGRVIRKLRIDELPQLFSVLAGDMSLVGPRPERPYFVDQLTRDIPFYAVRHSVKPGVTGWAQVNYHYGASVDDSVQKLQYDLYYVKNHTLLLDFNVLVKTVGVVLTGKGAQ